MSAFLRGPDSMVSCAWDEKNNQANAEHTYDELETLLDCATQSVPRR